MREFTKSQSQLTHLMEMRIIQLEFMYLKRRYNYENVRVMSYR